MQDTAGATYQLLPPAPAAALLPLKHAVGLTLPAELRELYQLSNGIAEYRRVAVGEAPVLVGYLLLPAEEAAVENRQQQPQILAEASLLIVARAYVDGIVFGYRRPELPAASAAIYAWLPIDDELVKVADSLAEFLVGWASGRISV